MRNRHVLACAALAVALAAAPTRAQSPPSGTGSAKPADTARELAKGGYRLFQAGSYAEAYDLFQQAEAKFHAPPHLLFMARCRAKVGKLVESRALYQRVLSEELDKSAPAPFREAQDSARTELPALESKLPSVRVSITGAPEARVTIDGTAAAVGEPIPLDPGEHSIAATADGTTPVTKTVSLSEGAPLEEIELTLVSAHSDRYGGDGLTLPVARGSIVPAIVAFAVGGAGLGVGAVTGLVAIGKTSDLKDKCPKNPCSESNRGLSDSARTFGTVSTVGFVIGGVGAAAGVALFVLRPFGPTTTAVAPRAGLGWVGVGGDF